MSNKPIRWLFEKPVDVTATVLANLTWNPATFGSRDHGDFTLNLWLLRDDSPENVDFVIWPPAILARNQSVFRNFVEWFPTLDDVDVGGEHPGSHQLAWERFADNPQVSDSNTTFRGFSLGFRINPAPDSSSSSSSISSTPTTSASTSSSNLPATITVTPTLLSSSPSSTSSLSSQTSGLSQSNAGSSPSSTSSANTGGTDQKVVLGLGIGLGFLGLIIILSAILFFLRRRKQKRNLVEGTGIKQDYETNPVEPPLPPPKNDLRGRERVEEMDAGYKPPEMEVMHHTPHDVPVELGGGETWRRGW